MERANIRGPSGNCGRTEGDGVSHSAVEGEQYGEGIQFGEWVSERWNLVSGDFIGIHFMLHFYEVWEWEKGKRWVVS